MRKLTLLFLLLSFTLYLSAQNFYVLSIKGSVSCNDKKLKKKDKLSIDDVLVFGDRESEIRLINSDGHYSLKGVMISPNQKNELIAELKKDLGIDRPVLESLVSHSLDYDPNDTRKYWYEFKPSSFYSTIITPSFITVDQEGEGSLQLVQVYHDTLLIGQPLKKVNGVYKLKQKHFKPKLAETPDYYAVVWLSATNPSLKDGVSFYSMRPTTFLKAKSLRKDMQFIKEKANIQHADDLVKMTREVLDDTYGKYKYIPKTLNPLVKKVMKK